jgi:hypothetical protein
MSNMNDANSGSRSTTGTRSTTTGNTSRDTGSEPVGLQKVSDTGDHRPGEGVLALLQRFGVDESAVNSLMTQWRGQLSDKVSQTIQEGDLVELFESAREMAKTSGTKLKTYAQTNPAMFYSGVAAIMAGAGLLAAAAKNAESADAENQDRGL